LAALKAVLKGKIPDDVFKAASGLAGGVGRTGNTCGAVTGGVMALSSFLGREYCDFFGSENMESLRIAKKLVDRFIKEYGSASCCDIQTKIMGRCFNFWKKEDEKAFLDSGGHNDKKKRKRFFLPYLERRGKTKICNKEKGGKLAILHFCKHFKKLFKQGGKLCLKDIGEKY